MSSDKNLTGFQNLSGLGQNIYLNSYMYRTNFHAKVFALLREKHNDFILILNIKYRDVNSCEPSILLVHHLAIPPSMVGYVFCPVQSAMMP
jgi:hypothetical protein